jgi:hypothetical protein
MSIRRFYTLIYICFIVIVVGAFASMAQNDYGLPLLAVGCFGLSLIMLFRIEGVQDINQTLFPRKWLIAELSGMAVMTLILGLRALFIRFPFVEYIFAVNALLLVAIYLGFARNIRRKYHGSKILRATTLLFYSSLILFLFSFVMIPFSLGYGELIGAISFGIIVLFLALSLLLFPNAIYNQDRVRTFTETTIQNNLSPILMIMLIMMSVYMGLTRTQLVPPLYSRAEPPRYLELVRQAELGEETREGGVYKYELFEQAYQQFLARRKEME